MTLEILLMFVSYIAILSIAAERAVELIKPMYDFGPFAKKLGDVSSQRRKNMNHGMAFLAGFALHLLSQTTVLYFADPLHAAFVMGLLASGGSGFWHDLLSLLKGYNQGTSTLDK